MEAKKDHPMDDPFLFDGRRSRAKFASHSHELLSAYLPSGIAFSENIHWISPIAVKVRVTSSAGEEAK